MATSLEIFPEGTKNTPARSKCFTRSQEGKWTIQKMTNAWNKVAVEVLDEVSDIEDSEMNVLPTTFDVRIIVRILWAVYSSRHRKRKLVPDQLEQSPAAPRKAVRHTCAEFVHGCTCCNSQ
jgi:hypothetical protein